jgi:hypothetical protein
MKRNLFFILFFVCGFFANAQAFAPKLAIVEFATDAQKTNQKEDVAAMRDMVNIYMTGLEQFNVMPNKEVNDFLIFNRIPLQEVYREEYYALFADENIAFILSANVSALDKGYRISYFFISTKKRLFYKSTVYNMRDNGADIRNVIQKSVKEFFHSIPLNPEDLASAYEEPKYAVGDRGPAGGIIFFVKANYAAGWRYLEAAPGDLNYKLPWGVWDGFEYLPDSPATSEDIGTGRHNTEIIALDKLRVLPIPTAAVACTNLDFNGFEDWFLPSKGELDLMYHVLSKNLNAGFQNGAYWTSTQSTTGAAWFQTFDNGRLYPNGLITEEYLVRAIRAF